MPQLNVTPLTYMHTQNIANMVNKPMPAQLAVGVGPLLLHRLLHDMCITWHA
jgi:hypothetical protein